MTDEVKDLITCPISLEIMRDPIIIVSSNKVCGRESFFTSVLSSNYLMVCPVSGQSFDKPLEYYNDMTARQLLMVTLGKSAYQPFDDSSFKREYYYELGYRYDYCEDDGVPRDLIKASCYYKIAADLGHAEAQNSLGDLYRDGGHGVSQDDVKARQYYEMAANQGLAAAQCSLGILYELGSGVSQDYVKARQYFELAAAAQGECLAQFILGSFYEKGLGGAETNYDKARKYYELAASQGQDEAQYRLGLLYAKGRGVSRDYMSKPCLTLSLR